MNDPKKMNLTIYSTEGTPDLIKMLEVVIEDVKSGLDSNETGGLRPDGYKAHTKWSIDQEDLMDDDSAN